MSWGGPKLWQVVTCCDGLGGCATGIPFLAARQRVIGSDMGKRGAQWEKEIPLICLDRSAPTASQTLLEFWNAHASAAGHIPTRTAFRPENLMPWIDDIAIYEFIPEKDDFLIMLEGENIVALTGENWRGAYAREVDCQFASDLHGALTTVRKTLMPQMHYLRIFQRQWRRGIRVLLPVLRQKEGKEDGLQIFLAIFPIDDEVQDPFKSN